MAWDEAEGAGAVGGGVSLRTLWGLIYGTVGDGDVFKEFQGERLSINFEALRNNFCLYFQRFLFLIKILHLQSVETQRHLAQIVTGNQQHDVRKLQNGPRVLKIESRVHRHTP